MRGRLPLGAAAVIAVVAMLVLGLACPPRASAWWVKNNAGVQKGHVVRIDHPWGASGVVYLDPPTPGQEYYPEIDKANGSLPGLPGFWIIYTHVGKLGYVFKGSSIRYTVRRRPDGTTVGRAARTSSGYWVVKQRINGAFRRIGSVQKGCPGCYALGAARVLIWH